MVGPFKSSQGRRRPFAIAKHMYLKYRFESRALIKPMPTPLLHAICSHEVVLPPVKLLGGEGSQTIEGLCFLSAAVKALKAKEMFEIGTFKGVTAWTLARNSDGGTVNTLDIPSQADAALPVEESDKHIRRQSSEPVYEEFPHDAEIVQWWGDSAEFDFSRWNGRCDLVLIDGAHSEPYVASDSQNAFDMVSDRGMIAWDDYWHVVQGVPDALHRIMHEHRLYRIPATRLCVHLTPGAEDLLSGH
jgi:predicted O-methyltransferase YrrM